MLKRIRRWLERLPKGIGNIFYWIRTHTYNKYHLINISGQDGYTWGYIDEDRAMMLACFKLLCDYVENGAKIVDWERDEPWRSAKKEIDYLYNWWKVERPRKLKEIEELYERLLFPRLKMVNELAESSDEEKAFTRKCYLTEHALEQEEDENLIRLMKIRRLLWS